MSVSILSLEITPSYMPLPTPGSAFHVYRGRAILCEFIDTDYSYNSQLRYFKVMVDVRSLIHYLTN